MGEKAGTKNEGEKNTAAPAEVVEKAAAAGREKKDEPVVLKLDLHCEGCAKKVRRSVRNLEGVETVRADCDAKKLTVTGNVDPAWLRDKVETKTKKKVELISPIPKKDTGNGAADGDDKKPEEKKADDVNKPKEAAVTTVMMKTKLHCDGCAHKIKRIITKNFDGVSLVTTDLQKDLITVVGTMDVNNLITYLREKLKRVVEIVPPKKDDGAAAAGEKKAKEAAAGDEKLEKSSGGGVGGGEEKKVKGSEGDVVGAKQKEGGAETKVEMSKMEHHSNIPRTHYAAMPMAMHDQSYGHQDYGKYHHQQSYANTGYVAAPPLPPTTYVNMDDNMFSDENPNGCHVM